MGYGWCVQIGAGATAVDDGDMCAAARRSLGGPVGVRVSTWTSEGDLETAGAVCAAACVFDGRVVVEGLWPMTDNHVFSWGSGCCVLASGIEEAGLVRIVCTGVAAKRRW